MIYSRRMRPKLNRQLLSLILATALAAAAQVAAPLHRPAAAAEASGCYRLAIPGGGDVDAGDLEGLISRLRDDYPSGPRAIVVMVHGFGTRPAYAWREYQLFTDRLRPLLGVGNTSAVVGISWKSYPGAPESWLSRAVGHRLGKMFGVGGGRDPYDTIAWRCQGVGRRGLRSVLFGLRDAFPGAAIHLVAHSLGARVAMNALAPDLTLDHVDGAPASDPARELKVDSIFMVGADLDSRLFVDGDSCRAARAALNRAGLWWFTVAAPNHPDKILKIRAWHTGRDVVGNSGPRLLPEDADRLLGEGRLIIDIGKVPAHHSFVDYLSGERMAEIGGALGQASLAQSGERQGVAGARQVLQSGSVRGAPPAASDIVDRVHQVLAAPASEAALSGFLDDRSAAVRLYAAWRLRRLTAPAKPVFEPLFTTSEAAHLVHQARNEP